MSNFCTEIFWWFSCKNKVTRPSIFKWFKVLTLFVCCCCSPNDGREQNRNSDDLIDIWFVNVNHILHWQYVSFWQIVYIVSRKITARNRIDVEPTAQRKSAQFNLCVRCYIRGRRKRWGREWAREKKQHVKCNWLELFRFGSDSCLFRCLRFDYFDVHRHFICHFR